MYLTIKKALESLYSLLNGTTNSENVDLNHENFNFLIKNGFLIRREGPNSKNSLLFSLFYKPKDELKNRKLDGEAFNNFENLAICSICLKKFIDRKQSSNLISHIQNIHQEHLGLLIQDAKNSSFDEQKVNPVSFIILFYIKCFRCLLNSEIWAS